LTKILICGLCPLPFENTLRSFGPGLRTWQFVHGLASRGHEVHLVAMQIDGAYEGRTAVARETLHSCPGEDGAEYPREVTVERLPSADFFGEQAVADAYARSRPDAVIGATTYGSYVLARLRPEVPFWADQFGHFMAEAQAKARLERENWPVAHFWKFLDEVLRRADRISTVSRRQVYATVGELGLVGRLSAETCGYEFTAVMPCALMPRPEQATRPMLRPEVVPADAFVVFWSGGYNVWSDVDTLFKGVEAAMEKEPRIHFVSTGGEIGGHDVRTYRDFQERVEASRFRDRYHLQGWVEAEDVPSYLAEANLGVLTDIPMYEGRLGHKNRIVQWMGAGLPVAYNEVGDLGEELRRHDLGLVFGVGDSAAFAARILEAAADPEALARMVERARRYTGEHLSIEATTVDVAAWAEDPTRAPDAAFRAQVRGPSSFAPAADASPEPAADASPEPAVEQGSELAAAAERCAAAEQRGAAAEQRCAAAEAEARDVRAQLAAVHGSKMWRVWMAYLAMRRWVTAPLRFFKS
jgi:glycosyltransferase involved in cell wall biosynthesis